MVILGKSCVQCSVINTFWSTFSSWNDGPIWTVFFEDFKFTEYHFFPNGTLHQAFFLCTWKKTQPTKKLKIWKKTHGFSKKNSRYRNLAVIALHREQKKLKKPKKNSELSKKTQKFSKKTHVTGIWQLSNPAKVHKKKAWVSMGVVSQDYTFFFL